MDGGDRRQSQYGTPYQSYQAGRTASGQFMGPPSQDAYPQTGPSPARGTSLSGQPTARPYMSEDGYTYQQPQFPSQIQYPTSYVTDPSRQQQIQQTPGQSQYGPYGSMLPPVAQQSMYDNMSHYQQRQSTALEVMTNQFGSGGMQFIPQETSSPVGVGQTGPSYLSTQPEQQSYSSMSYGRPQLQPSFAPNPSEYLTLEQSVSQQSQEEAITRQAIEEGRRQYEQQIRSVFDAILAGRVTDASNKLFTATEWLVGSIKALGLHYDDEESQPERVGLWRELNHAWEALGQKQKIITENALRTQQQPADYLTGKNIRDLIDKLVQFCDAAEKHGLVDYEMGIWEEQIIDVFIKCLDLLPQEQTALLPASQSR